MLNKFKTMDIEWSIVEEDGEYYLHIVIPSPGVTEYEFDLKESKRLHQKLGQLIKKIEKSATPAGQKS